MHEHTPGTPKPNQTETVDADMRLPGINDDFTVGAPDLGAYETGRPLPHDGPKPARKR